MVNYNQSNSLRKPSQKKKQMSSFAEKDKVYNENAPFGRFQEREKLTQSIYILKGSQNVVPQKKSQNENSFFQMSYGNESLQSRTGS